MSSDADPHSSPPSSPTATGKNSARSSILILQKVISPQKRATLKEITESSLSSNQEDEENFSDNLAKKDDIPTASDALELIVNDPKIFTGLTKDDIEHMSSEILQRKRNKRQEKFVNRQERIFKKDFEGHLDYEEKKVLFQKSERSLNFKNLLSQIKAENSGKQQHISNLNETLKNYNNKTRGEKIGLQLKETDHLFNLYRAAKLDFFQTDINANLANEMIDELKVAKEDIEEKMVVETMKGETLSNMEKKIKERLERKEGEVNELKQILKICENEKLKMDEKLVFFTQKTDDLFFKLENGNFDMEALEKFHEEVLKRKNDLKNSKTTDLKDEILSILENNRKLAEGKQTLAEQEKIIFKLDHEFGHKKKFKIQSAAILNSLDYFDRIAKVFMYNDPDEYDITGDYLDLDKEIDLKCAVIPSTTKLDRRDSMKSLKSTSSIMSGMRIGKSKDGEKKTALGIYNKLTQKKHNDPSNFNFSLSMLNKRVIFNESNCKKLGVERIHRFSKMHGEISEFFTKVSNGYSKLLIEETSYKTRIEDLNEQKKRLFEFLIDAEKELKILFAEIPKEKRDLMINQSESQQEIPSQNEINDSLGSFQSIETSKEIKSSKETFSPPKLPLTINDLRFVLYKSPASPPDFFIQDLNSFESLIHKTFLCLNELISRSASITSSILSIKQNYIENDPEWVDIVHEIIHFSANYNQKMSLNEDNEVIETQMSIKKMPSKMSLNMSPTGRLTKTQEIITAADLKKNPMSSKISVLKKIFLKLFPNFQHELIEKIMNIIKLDFVLYNFISIKGFSSIFQELQKIFEAKRFSETANVGEKELYLLTLFENHILEAKGKATEQLMKTFHTLFNNAFKLFSNIRTKTHETMTYIKVANNIENSEDSGYEEQIYVDNDHSVSTQPVPAKNEVKFIRPESEIITRNRVYRLAKAGLIGDEELTWKIHQEDCKSEKETMDIELEDDMERERLKKAMEKVPKGHHEEDEFKVNKAAEKFYMISLEKSRRKKSKEFRECVHYAKKFEEVFKMNVLQEKKKELSQLRETIRGYAGFKPSEISDPQTPQCFFYNKNIDKNAYQIDLTKLANKKVKARSKSPPIRENAERSTKTGSNKDFSDLFPNDDNMFHLETKNPVRTFANTTTDIYAELRKERLNLKKNIFNSKPGTPPFKETISSYLAYNLQSRASSASPNSRIPKAEVIMKEMETNEKNEDSNRLRRNDFGRSRKEREEERKILFIKEKEKIYLNDLKIKVKRNYVIRSNSPKR